MGYFLQKRKTYIEVDGGSIRKWVQGRTWVHSTAIYEEPTTIDGDLVSHVGYENCTTKTFPVDPSSPLYDPSNPFTTLSFCDVTHGQQVTPVQVIPGKLIGYETFTTTDEGHWLTVELPNPLVPVSVNAWNSSAVSKFSAVGNVKAAFDMNHLNSVFVLGLNTTINAGKSTPYVDIKHGFLISSDSFSIIENGVDVFDSEQIQTGYSLVHGDKLEIELISNSVSYKVNGATVFQSVSKFNTADSISMDASLYLQGTEIHNAELISLPASASITFNEDDPPFQAFTELVLDDPLSFNFNATSRLFTELTVIITDNKIRSFSELTLDTLPVHVNSGHIEFQPIVGFGSDTEFAEGFLSFEPLKLESTSGLTQNFSGGGYGNIAPLTITATWITGQSNTASNMNFEPLEVLGAEGNYAEGKLSFEPLECRGVQLQKMMDGVVFVESEGGFGNATLLRSGKHLLTAAHVVENFTDLSLINLDFFASSQVFVAPRKVVGIITHPDYVHTKVNGVTTVLNNDLAILILDDEVIPLVRRHDIYQGDNEVGNTFRRLSRTFQVNPNTGVKGAIGWSETTNKFDIAGELIPPLLSDFETPPNGTTLGYDFDSGHTTHDAIGDKFGISGLGTANEGVAQQGDSGSASFFTNGVIAGVASYGATLGSPPDIHEGFDSTYGEVAVDTKVSEYVNWINNAVPEMALLNLIKANVNAKLGLGLLIAATGSVSTGNATTIKLQQLTINSHTGAVATIPSSPQGLSINSTVILSRAVRATLRAIRLSITATLVKPERSNITLVLPRLKIKAHTGANAKSLKVVGHQSFSLAINSTILLSPSFNALLNLNDSLKLSISASYTSHTPTIVSFKLPLLKAVYGHVSITLPVLKIDATTDGAVNVSLNPAQLHTGRAYSVNVLHSELTVYSNYNFDKIVRFNGLYYGVSNDGLYLIEGVKDLEVNIKAHFKINRLDFGTSLHKRVPYLYIDSVDDTMVEPFTEEEIDSVNDESRKVGDYLTVHNGRRCKLAKGARGRYWSFRVSNVNGSELDVRSLELFAEIGKRKV